MVASPLALGFFGATERVGVLGSAIPGGESTAFRLLLLGVSFFLMAEPRYEARFILSTPKVRLSKVAKSR